jgi:hypothetical protein
MSKAQPAASPNTIDTSDANMYLFTGPLSDQIIEVMADAIDAIRIEYRAPSVP